MAHQQKNWVSTVGENIDVIEKQIAQKIGRKQAVALSCGTAALHLSIKLAAEKLYGMPQIGHGLVFDSLMSWKMAASICLLK